MRYKSIEEIERSDNGTFKTREDCLVNNEDWLYQKYVVERLKWSEFYNNYGISPVLLANRLKKFGIQRTLGKAWNAGLKGVLKPNSGSFKSGVYGEDAPGWKGGISTKENILRGSVRYKEWRRQVFERDKSTCVWCGAKNESGKKVVLHADHIKPFSKYPELRFDVDNGRVLCFDCHKKTFSRKNKKDRKSVV